MLTKCDFNDDLKPSIKRSGGSSSSLKYSISKKNLSDLEKQAKTVKVSIASYPCSISIVNMFSLYTMSKKKFADFKQNIRRFSNLSKIEFC